MHDFQRNGLLAPGVHRMPIEKVESVFVQNCDHLYDRQRIYDAIRLLLELVPPRFGLSQIFISGPFVTKRTRAPKYANVAIVPRSRVALERVPPEQAVKIMSLGSVVIGRPDLMSFTQIDPMGGLIRSTVAYEDDEIAYSLMIGMLRTAIDHAGKPIRDTEQGYLELVL